MTRRTRLGIFSFLLFLLFWGSVYTHLSSSRTAPKIAATVRFVFEEGDGRMENLWRYTGPRPTEDEVLRVFYRQAPSWEDRDHVTPIAYVGSTVRPVREQLSINPPEASDGFIAWQHVDLENWRSDGELWIGLASRPDARHWAERGPSPAQLGDVVYRRSDPNHDFRRGGYEYFSSLWPRIVKRDTPAPEPLQPFRPLALFAAIGMFGALLIKGERASAFVYAGLQCVLLYKAFEVLFPSQALWGGFHHARIGEWIFWCGLPIVQLLALPVVADLLAYHVRRRMYRIHPEALKIVFIGCAAVIAGMVWWVATSYPSKGIYGDGYGALGWPGYDYHNPFATAIYHAWRDVYTAVSANSPGPYDFVDMQLVPVFVAMWAPVYVMAAAWLSLLLSARVRQAFLFFSVILLMKPVLSIFGYLEVYGPALALHLIFACILVRAFRKGGVLLPTGFSFFTYLFHMQGAMLLPAVLALWVRKCMEARGRGAWLAVRIPSAMVTAVLLWVVCLAMLFHAKHDGDWRSFTAHVPGTTLQVSGGERIIYGFPFLYGSTGRPMEEVFLSGGERYITHLYSLGKVHATQLLGEIVFVSGPVLAVLLVAIGGARRRLRSEHLGILATAGAFLLTSLFLATNYPYPKDWDVFSINALWWMIALLCVLPLIGARLRRRILLALIAYLAWDTIPWVVYNLTWGPVPMDRNFVFY